MATVEAKGKVRTRHHAGIENYKKWLEEHPDATLKKRIREFDKQQDAAYLNNLVK